MTPPPARRFRTRDVTRKTSAARFVATLRRVADAIESGRPFRIQVAGETIVVPADAEPSIEHERSGGAHELELQLRWNDLRASASNDRRRRGGAVSDPCR